MVRRKSGLLYIFIGAFIVQTGNFMQVIFVSASPEVFHKSVELHNALLSNYIKDDIPSLASSSPLRISVTFHLTSIMDLNEIDGDMVTVGYLTAIWVDPRLAWNPMEYGGIGTIMVASEKIWTPNLLLGNPSKLISNFNKDLTRARILYNGTVILMPGDVFRTRCEFNIYRYPFDNQSCHLSFMAWPYSASEVVIHIPCDEVTTPFFQENGEWYLMGSSSRTYNKHNFSVADFQLHLERRSEFFVVNIILPIVSICFLACLVFLIPHETGERISYTITVLLSFAVFMTLVSDNIPKTSAPMSLLCYYLFGLFFGSVLLMLNVIYTSRLFNRDSSIPVTNTFKRIATCFKFKRNPRVNARNKVLPTSVSETVMKDEPVYEYRKREKAKARLENAQITWQDVTRGLDKLCFIMYIFYFCSISLGIVLFVQLHAI